MLGLACSKRRDLLRDMVGNFAYLIDTYGHVPNRTRSYYLSRSQPPLFAFMVELAQQHGSVREVDCPPQLRQQHVWWMSGSEGLAPGTAARRVVRLPGGEVLDRYCDERSTPGEESWLEDVTTARGSGCDPSQVYRDLRAAAKSGWDLEADGCVPPRSTQALQRHWQPSAPPTSFRSTSTHFSTSWSAACSRGRRIR